MKVAPGLGVFQGTNKVGLTHSWELPDLLKVGWMVGRIVSSIWWKNNWREDSRWHCTNRWYTTRGKDRSRNKVRSTLEREKYMHSLSAASTEKQNGRRGNHQVGELAHLARAGCPLHVCMGNGPRFSLYVIGNLRTTSKATQIRPIVIQPPMLWVPSAGLERIVRVICRKQDNHISRLSILSLCLYYIVIYIYI